MLDFLSNKFGLLFVILIIFFLWLTYLTFLFQSYVRDKRKVLSEAKEKGIDFVLQNLNRQTKKQELDIKELYRLSEDISRLSAKSITHFGMIRYNPYQNTGGDLSFSLALLNTHRNGIIISGLHGREGTRIFSKPLESGQSKYQLSKEEKKAIEVALNS